MNQNTNNWEDLLKDKLLNHEEAAPLADGIFAQRGTWHVFKNRLIIHKLRIISGAAALMLIIASVWWFGDIKNDRQSLAGESTKSPVISQHTIHQKTESAISPQQNDQNSEENHSSEIRENGATTQNNNQSTSNVIGGHPNPSSNKNNGEMNNNHDGFGENELPGENPVATETPGYTDVLNKSQESQTENTADLNHSKELADKPSHENTVDGLGRNGENPDDKTSSDQAKELANQTETPANREIPEDVDSDSKTEGHHTDLPDNPPIRKWSVDVLAGVAYGDRTLSGSNANWSTLRNRSESPAISSQAVIRANYEFSTRWEGTLGLSFTQRKEQLNYDRTREFKTMDVNSHEVTVYDPVLPPKTVTTYDTTYQNIQVTSNIKGVNTYSYLNLPIGLRYSFLYTNKWSAFAGSSVAILIGTRNNGFILNPVGNEMNLNTSAYSRYKMACSVNFTAGATYNLNQRFSLIGELNTNKYFRPNASVTFGSNAIRQSDLIYGFRAGLSYKF
ncbi:MAG: hypothetical protein GC181_05985 [Bacteroidetes bacterium]|nr:hypothetical protein [Bacteroidota bacterium]